MEEFLPTRRKRFSRAAGRFPKTQVRGFRQRVLHAREGHETPAAGRRKGRTRQSQRGEKEKKKTRHALAIFAQLHIAGTLLTVTIQEAASTARRRLQGRLANDGASVLNEL
ncbi:hypothetical protein MRX96_013675 [Rhipicephalus microplus]